MELLIVIALIGILVTMGVASYSTAQSKSRDSRRKADMKVLQNAFEQYYSDNSSDYPDNTGEVTAEYLPGGLPTEPKPAPYEQYTPNFDADGPIYYCYCAAVEDDTQGNADSNNGCATLGTCVGAACTHYCVRNLQ